MAGLLIVSGMLPISVFAGEVNLNSSGEYRGDLRRQAEDQGAVPEEGAEAEAAEAVTPPAGEAEPRVWPTPIPQRFSSGRFEEARALLAKRKWAEAVVVLKDLAGLHPASQRVALDLAKALMQLGQREEALATLAALVPQLQGRSKEAMIKRISVYSKVFRSDENYQVYQEGLNFMSAGRFVEARERFNKVLKHEPAQAQAYLRIGQCNLAENSPAEGLEVLRNANRLNAFDPVIKAWLGHALSRLGKFEEAVVLLEQSFNEDPASELSPRWYAEGLLASRQRDRAIEVLKEDVKRNPMHLNSLSLLAEIRTGVGSNPKRLKEARKDLQLAISRIEDYRKARKRGPVTDYDWIPYSADALKQDIEGQLGRIESRLEAATPNAG